MIAPAIAAFLALGVAACGSGDDSVSTSAVGAGTIDSTATAPSASGDRDSGGAKPPGGADSGAGEASADFLTPGGDNSIQNFGGEASDEERDAASTVLEAYMRVRSEDAWAEECMYLAAPAIDPLEELVGSAPGFKGEGCAAILSALGRRSPQSLRANTMSGPIASLRVEGYQGFALYHGTRGIDYFMPMRREGGEWKVGSLAPTEFPRGRPSK